MRVVGADGTPKGWVAVFLANGRVEAVRLAPDFGALMARASGCAAIGVDIPVGLLDAGERAADGAAREAVGKALRSSVFPVPPRGAVEAPDWPTALARARRDMGKGISKQSYYLFPKIREVDAHAGDARVVEVHPEVSFATLKGAPLATRKKTWAGAEERRTLLARAGIVVPADIGAAGRAPVDDVLDAAVVAWSAARVAAGTARAFAGEPAQLDPRGRRIAIFA